GEPERDPAADRLELVRLRQVADDLLLHARAQQRRALEARMGVAREIGEAADHPGDRAPAVRALALWSEPVGDPVAGGSGGGRQVALRALEREVDRVAPVGELRDQRRVLPLVERGPAEEEEDAQAPPGAHRANHSLVLRTVAARQGAIASAAC